MHGKRMPRALVPRFPGTADATTRCPALPNPAFPTRSTSPAFGATPNPVHIPHRTKKESSHMGAFFMSAPNKARCA